MPKSMVSSDHKFRIAGIIPARYASSRFPGKPLALIDGVTMIGRVYRQAVSCPDLVFTAVATDDSRIADEVRRFGGKVVMTSADHTSGTDRLGEAIRILEREGEHFDIAVNIQGDEPYIKPEQISKVIRLFSSPETSIATLIKQIDNQADLFNPNVVKVVVDARGKALIFSRSPVPYLRGIPEQEWVSRHVYYKHIGIYAYRTTSLLELVNLSPAPPEVAESLEQLRWLWNGYSIYTEVTDFETTGIDTPEDLLKLTNNP